MTSKFKIQNSEFKIDKTINAKAALRTQRYNKHTRTPLFRTHSQPVRQLALEKRNKPTSLPCLSLFESEPRSDTPRRLVIITIYGHYS